MVNTADIDGFDWDEGNRDKNWLKHAVSTSECEELFFNLPLVVAVDFKHSEIEDRFLALGKTNNARLLFVSFTVRDRKIRVISARDMSRKEREAYEKANS